MSDNPYSSPISQSSGGFSGSIPPGSDSFVKQVPVVGILMIVGGSLEFLVGMVYVVLGFWLPGFVVQSQAIGPSGQMSAEEIEFMQKILFWTYFGMGSGGAIGGLLRLVGGIQVLRFRTYILGIIGCIAGLAGVATCYCSPISLGFSIYGMIVLFQSSVRQEFASRSGQI